MWSGRMNGVYRILRLGSPSVLVNRVKILFFAVFVACMVNVRHAVSGRIQGALGHFGDFKNARGLAHSKTWRIVGWFMGRIMIVRGRVHLDVLTIRWDEPLSPLRGARELANRIVSDSRCALCVLFAAVRGLGVGGWEGIRITIVIKIKIKRGMRRRFPIDGF